MLTDVLKEVERIIRNWDNYERVTEEDKYLEFQEKVDELIEKYDSNYYLAEYLAYLDTLNLNLNHKKILNDMYLYKKEKISIPETKRKAKILFYDDKKNTKKGDNNE